MSKLVTAKLAVAPEQEISSVALKWLNKFEER